MEVRAHACRSPQHTSVCARVHVCVFVCVSVFVCVRVLRVSRV